MGLSDQGEDMESEAGRLVAKLESGDMEETSAAARELRLLCRSEENSRRYVADAGGIEALVALLQTTFSSHPEVQENAVTALLNLSVDSRVRLRITETYGALDAVLGVLTGAQTSSMAKENAAATLFSLLIVDEYRDVVGQHPVAIPALLSLLRDVPTRRAKKDAIKGLFHLALHDANKPRLVAHAAVPLLISTVVRRLGALVEESLSLLALLALCEQGATAIVAASGIPVLVEILGSGAAPQARENALAVLLALCRGGDRDVVQRVGAYNHQIVASLCSVLVIGSARGKRKASELMRMLVVAEESDTDDSVSGSSRSYNRNGSSFWDAANSDGSLPRSQV